MIWMMKRLHTLICGYVYYKYIISDDDITIRKHLTHHKIRPTENKYIGGYLPKDIPVLQWFTDPNHCVILKMRIKKSVEGFRKNIMAPSDHMSDDHYICDSNRCYKKRIYEDKIMSLNEKKENKNIGYYMCKVKDDKMYKKLCKKYKFYTTEEKTTQ